MLAFQERSTDLKIPFFPHEFCLHILADMTQGEKKETSVDFMKTFTFCLSNNHLLFGDISFFL